MHKLSKITLAALLLAAFAGLSDGPRWSGCALAADEVTVDKIVKALKKPKTQRSGEGPASAAQEIEDLKRIRKTRGWNQEDRARFAKAAEDLGQIDITVYFAFDSAEIENESEPM